MFTQLNLHLILVLIAVIVILGGGWWYQSSRDASAIDVLKANNARLEDALALNEARINNEFIKSIDVLRTITAK